MGLRLSKLIEFFLQPKKRSVIMVGLDAAGKTTVLYKLKLGEVVATVPTVGFNVETVNYRSVTFTVWDVGGQKLLRSLWRHYYQGVEGVIFVIDSNDRERITEAKEELEAMLKEAELRDAVVLIYANKQDLPNAVTVSELVEKMDLNKMTTRKWFVQPCCAKTGDGLYEGLEWLCDALL